MLIEVAQFCDRVRRSMGVLVTQLQDETDSCAPSEAAAWENSLPQLANVLDDPALRDYHLHLGSPGSLSLEYRLPASASRCDAVLLGRGTTGPAAVVIELKAWELLGDRAGPREGLVYHRGELVLHPSEQVRGYVDYCRHFHSAVLAHQADVQGCVLFTKRGSLAPYRQTPHAQLTGAFPLFNSEEPGEWPVEFIRRHLDKPDPGFAQAFEDGRYEQNRQFVTQVADAIRDVDASPFVLLDEQRRGFEYCLERIDRMLAERQKKVVVIVEGPPGSGKSVLAAHLWAALTKDRRLLGNIVFTTTSSCQKSNWKSLYDRTKRGSKAVVIPANQYNPGLTTKWLNARTMAGNPATVSEWRQNLTDYLATGKNKSLDDAYDVSVVDEAHALIDPTAPNAAGVYPSGWIMQAGPQAWHIIRSSRVSIFLMDSAQSYRENETTTAERITEWAIEQGATTVERISLAAAQFRCGGSVEYVRWLETGLGLQSSAGPVDGWMGGGHKAKFQFNVVDDPLALEVALRDRLKAGANARIVASYAREWKTKDSVIPPHGLPDAEKDFLFSWMRDRQYHSWSRIWNYAPKEDYTRFIQASPGSQMAADPLCEVGCPYVMRGFDYDYLGLLWLGDLVWRNGRWVAQLDHVKETAYKRTLQRAKRGAGAADPDLLLRLKRGYRILLTRAIKGVFVWFEDKETRDHVQSLLPK